MMAERLTTRPTDIVRQLPLALTCLRILASPLLVYLLIKSQFRAALFLVLMAGATDWLDGYTARKLGVSGRAGVILDPLADKVMLVTLFCALAFIGRVPLWMLALVLGRDLVIVIGALLLRQFRGHRRFLPTIWGKVSTFFQIVLVFLVLVYAAYPYRLFDWLRITALVLSAFFTAASWMDYVRIGIYMTRHPAILAVDPLTSVDGPNARE